MCRFFWLMSGLLLFAAPISSTASEILSERVAFFRNANSALFESSIKGYAVVDYVVGVKAGEYMKVNLATKRGAIYFNIMAPGENEVAIFTGSTSGNQYEGTLTASGDYKIRVYMMRSAARRNAQTYYRLEITLDDTRQPAVQRLEQDVMVAGTEFHAVGNLRCSRGEGQPSGSCAFGVKRESGGSAMVVVSKGGGEESIIFFENGRAIGYDQCEADFGPFEVSKEADLNIIHIGEERYEIPDAVIFGG